MYYSSATSQTSYVRCALVYPSTRCIISSYFAPSAASDGYARASIHRRGIGSKIKTWWRTNISRKDRAGKKPPKVASPNTPPPVIPLAKSRNLKTLSASEEGTSDPRPGTTQLTEEGNTHTQPVNIPFVQKETPKSNEHARGMQRKNQPKLAGVRIIPDIISEDIHEGQDKVHDMYDSRGNYVRQYEDYSDKVLFSYIR